ncbi:hypothetical protein [Enterobacter oligotrophicus]|uniref:hypothetical protein n=1 Tax=Enterobacter oligotrophicus TaxID=2478464 RepID=UPI0028A65E73|nr:hypothetical protein [Enterobacter oligotrophicus]
MNKKELAILEKAWMAEIDNDIPIIQTKSKIAAQLAEEGYLKLKEFTLGGAIPVVIRGYQITHAGILAYCLSLPDDIDIEAMEEEMRK